MEAQAAGAEAMKKILCWLRYVVTPTPYPERWQDRLFTGHVSLGSKEIGGARIVVYGANAMHWAVNIHFRRFGDWWCFHPTTRTFGGRWRWYFYISTDATPCTAHFAIGPGVND